MGVEQCLVGLVVIVATLAVVKGASGVAGRTFVRCFRVGGGCERNSYAGGTTIASWEIILDKLEEIMSGGSKAL